jgi:hypothetical protein
MSSGLSVGFEFTGKPRSSSFGEYLRAGSMRSDKFLTAASRCVGQLLGMFLVSISA